MVISKKPHKGHHSYVPTGLNLFFVSFFYQTCVPTGLPSYEYSPIYIAISNARARPVRRRGEICPDAANQPILLIKPYK
jgi:hypothetical protein